MMNILMIIILLLLVIVGALSIIVYFKRRSFGSLSQNHIYSDTQQMPGTVLYSESFMLKGKPDYILKKGSEYVPVEVKSGKTPVSPYRNHIMQLSAYCALIEENYNFRPPVGVIKYPEKEFTIEYTDALEGELKKIISEMMNLRSTGQEISCNHPEHNAVSVS